MISKRISKYPNKSSNWIWNQANTDSADKITYSTGTPKIETNQLIMEDQTGSFKSADQRSEIYKPRRFLTDRFDGRDDGRCVQTPLCRKRYRNRR